MGSASPCGEPGPWVCEASRDRERLPRGLEGRGAAGRPGSRKRPLQGPRGGLEAELVAGGTIRTGRRLPEKWRQRGLTFLALKQFPQKTPPQVSGSLRRLPSAKMAARATSEGAAPRPAPGTGGWGGAAGDTHIPAWVWRTHQRGGGQGLATALPTLTRTAPPLGLRTPFFVARTFIIGLPPITG